ncbi:MAG: hypothetical protein KAR40_17915 [Candidatus Sabulitectum sp.]|nr:hypothetical protein [Candidatus Sabulitectum sp.]
MKYYLFLMTVSLLVVNGCVTDPASLGLPDDIPRELYKTIVYSSNVHSGCIVAEKNQLFLLDSDYPGGVGVFDLASYTKVIDITIGAYSASGIDVNPTGDLVYVVAEDLYTIDPYTYEITQTTDLAGTGSDLVCMQDKVYVSMQWDDCVYVIDSNSYEISDTISVGEKPTGMCLSVSDEYLYVANYDSDEISVINTGNDSVVASISVAHQPSQICALPDGKSIYVSCYSGSVSVIDTNSNTVTDQISVGLRPFGICSLPNGDYVYVCCASGGVGVNGYAVVVIHTESGLVLGGLDFPGACWVLPSLDGSEVYVSSDYPSSSTIKVFR